MKRDSVTLLVGKKKKKKKEISKEKGPVKKKRACHTYVHGTVIIYWVVRMTKGKT